MLNVLFNALFLNDIVLTFMKYIHCINIIFPANNKVQCTRNASPPPKKRRKTNNQLQKNN